MRKQNSTFKTAFISEAGSGLENNDYFAFVELEKYACYVIADGLNDLPDAESARLATQTIILAFEEHPSIKRRAVLSYLEAANKALQGADSREKLKASITVVVTDYAKARYGYAGNTRLRFYREGAVKEQTTDMSLGTQLIKEKELPEIGRASCRERV
nr:serine/threonine protein phosphatase [Enterocloster clostridioformis]